MLQEARAFLIASYVRYIPPLLQLAEASLYLLHREKKDLKRVLYGAVGGRGIGAKYERKPSPGLFQELPPIRYLQKFFYTYKMVSETEMTSRQGSFTHF